MYVEYKQYNPVVLRAMWIRSTEISNDLMGNQTRDPPACSIVPQPTTLPRAPNYER
jgi:hypothetical protein